MKTKQKNENPIYVAQLAGAALAARRHIYRQQLDMLKQCSVYDKQVMKRQRKELVSKINECNLQIAEAEKEVYRQNHQVVSAMLLAFICCDLVSETLDHVGDVFNKVTIGKMKDELADFVTLCRQASKQANDVVVTIDHGGNDTLSMAYAEVADDITTEIKGLLMRRIEQFADTAEGKRLFYGYH